MELKTDIISIARKRVLSKKGISIAYDLNMTRNDIFLSDLQRTVMNFPEAKQLITNKHNAKHRHYD